MPAQKSSTHEVSGWAIGYTAFAGVVLTMIGIFASLHGLIALLNNEFYVTTQKWVFKFNITTWGWIHFILGIIVLLSGIGIYSGNVLARTVGVFVAAVTAIITFAWLPYYPVWGVLIIALCIAVIWALTVHGRDIVAGQ